MSPENPHPDHPSLRPVWGEDGVLVSVEDDSVEPLTLDQRTRAAALREARACLERRPSIGGLSPSTPPSADDLIFVARWIIHGTILGDE